MNNNLNKIFIKYIFIFINIFIFVMLFFEYISLKNLNTIYFTNANFLLLFVISMFIFISFLFCKTIYIIYSMIKYLLIQIKIYEAQEIIRNNEDIIKELNEKIKNMENKK